jgi:hypothetical protein
MSDPPSAPADSLTQRPTAAVGNRLSIAHLLLWMTMTAVVFGFLQPHVPPTEEQASTGNPRFDEMVRRSREMQHWGFLSLLVFAPAYGATLAAVGLAGYRWVRRRFDFPAQPGHWLLFVLAVIPATACSVAVRGPPLNEFPTFCCALLYVTIVSACAVVQIRKPQRWRWVFILAASAFLIVWVDVGSDALSKGFVGPGMFAVIGLVVLICSLLTALACSVLDLTAAERYDMFHWTGIAILFATIGHVFVLWGIDVGFRV